MKKVLGLAVAVVLVAGLTLSVGSGMAYGADMKLGYIDVEKVFNDYEYTKDEDSRLKEVGRQKAQERDSMVSEIKQLKEEAELLSETAAQEKQASIDGRIMDLKEFDKRTRTELRNERDQLLKDIFDRIRVAIESYGKQNGYTFIFNDKALLYKIESYDLTEEITKILNDGYKAAKDKK